jgi:hypothetical protein
VNGLVVYFLYENFRKLVETQKFSRPFRWPKMVIYKYTSFVELE